MENLVTPVGVRQASPKDIADPQNEPHKKALYSVLDTDLDRQHRPYQVQFRSVPKA